MPTYTAWPTETDILARLARAGVTLKVVGEDETAAILSVTTEVTLEVEKETRRQFIVDPDDTTRTFDGSGTAELEVDEMVSLTSVAVIGMQADPGYSLSGVTLAEERNRPRTRLLSARGSLPAYATSSVYAPYHAVFPAGRQNIQVTGKFGYGVEIPRDLWEAVAGEIADRLAEEAAYEPDGREVELKEGGRTVKYEYEPREKAARRQRFRAAMKRYRKPAGKRLRNLRPGMV